MYQMMIDSPQIKTRHRTVPATATAHLLAALLPSLRQGLRRGKHRISSTQKSQRENSIHDHFFLTLHGVSTSFVPISCHTMHQDACVPRSATSLLPEALRQSHLQSHAALLSA